MSRFGGYPLLTSLPISTPNASNTSNTPKRRDYGDALKGFILDLPPEIITLIMIAVAKDTSTTLCETLKAACRSNFNFSIICAKENHPFWIEVLRTKGWLPDWTPEELPGGLTPKSYYIMVCELDEKHRLALLELKQGTTTIRPNMFRYSKRLTIKLLPSSITSIGDFAFERCDNLVLTSLPPMLQRIGYASFSMCFRLALNDLPNSLLSIEGYAFYKCTEMGRYMTSFPNQLTTIPEHCFEDCAAFGAHLQTLSEGTEEIMWHAFDGCHSLALTELPPNLKDIQQHSFRLCKSVRFQTLPASILYISEGAFFGCDSLSNTFRNMVETIQSDAFKDTI
jgi:hypothetical protein